MTTIGKVAYIATWDATQLTKGVMTSRQLFSSQKKILEASRSPLERYVDGLTNLQNIVQKYNAVAPLQFQLEQQLEKQYLKEAQAVRVLTTEEQRRLKILSMGDTKQVGRSNEELKRQATERKRIYDTENRDRGMAEQRRLARYTKVVDQESAIARRALQERLRLHQQEKAADEQRSRNRIRESLRRIGYEEQELQRVQRLRNSPILGLSSGAAGMASSGGGGRGMGAAALAFGGRFAAAAGLTVTAFKIVDMTNKTAEMNRELERTESAMAVFTGSLAGSETMIRKIRDLSAESGVSFAAYNQGARTMLNFGLAADLIMPKLREISIVTGGDPDRMRAMALAFAQVGAAGKLMGQEVIQMVNAGWSPFEEISKKLNKTWPELRKEMEAGNISFQMVSDAMTTATEAGGRYHGFLEALEGTSARVFDKQNAAWEETGAKVGEALEPATKLWNLIKLDLAKDVGNIANAFIKQKDVIEEISGIEKQREASRARLAATIANEAAIFKRMREEAASERQAGLDAIPDLMSRTVGGLFEPQKVAEFERIVSLLNDVHKSQATEDMIYSKGNLDVVRSYLHEDVRLELERVEAIEKQVALIEKRKDLEEAGQRVAEKLFTDQERLTGSLTELRLAHMLGKIDQATFDRGVKEATPKRSDGSQITSGVQKGSQEAYQFLVQVQMQASKMQSKKQQEQIDLQKAMVDSLERAEKLLAEIADVDIGVDG